jgi:hypothetical protein
MPTTRVQSINEIPFDTIAIDHEYLVANPSRADIVEAYDRLKASPRCIGTRRPIVTPYGQSGTVKVALYAASEKVVVKKGPRGRPPTDLNKTIADLEVGGHTLVHKSQLRVATLRVTASRIGQAHGRTFTVRQLSAFDDRVDWQGEAMAGQDHREFMVVTRAT